MHTVRASEIGEYLYCHRAWWLHHVQGYSSTNVQVMAEGTETHAGHGRRVGLAAGLRALALLLFILAIVTVVASVALR